MNYKELYEKITTAINNGLAIQVTTSLVSVIYTRPEQFKYNENGVYAQRGNGWQCVSWAKINCVKLYND